MILAFMLNYRHVNNTFVLSTEIQSLGVALEFHLKGQKLRFWGFSQFSLSVFGFYIVFVLLFVQRFMKLRQTRKQRNPFYQASDDCTPIHTNNNFVFLGFASPARAASRGVWLIISSAAAWCDKPRVQWSPAPASVIVGCRAPTLSVTFIMAQLALFAASSIHRTLLHPCPEAIKARS